MLKGLLFDMDGVLFDSMPYHAEAWSQVMTEAGFNFSREDVYMNEDMVKYPEVWEKIHAKLADHGFILRYLEGKEKITGYNKKSWNSSWQYNQIQFIEYKHQPRWHFRCTTFQI